MSEQVWDEMAEAINSTLLSRSVSLGLAFVPRELRHEAMRAALRVIVQARPEQYEALSARDFAWQDVDSEFVWRVMAEALISERKSEDYVKAASVTGEVREPVNVWQAQAGPKTVKELLTEAVRPTNPDPVVVALEDLGRSLAATAAILRGLQGGGK